MSELEIPEDELKKLEQAIGLKVLSSDEADVYNVILETASYLIECPIVGITLFNPPGRQWVKSYRGFTHSEAPNTGVFYDAILKDPREVFIVKNALLDPRFKDDPNVTGGLSIRFAMGICMFDDKDKFIGVLSLADNVARSCPADSKIESLKYLAKFTGLIVQLREFIVEVYDEIQELKSFPGLDGYEMHTEELFSKLDKALEKIKIRRKYFR